MKGCIMDTLSSTLTDKLSVLLESYRKFQMSERGYQLYKVVNTGNNLYHVLSLQSWGNVLGQN